MQISAYIGFDCRFPLAYAVTARSLLQKTILNIPVTPLVLADLVAKRIYDRPTVRDGRQMIDVISGAPMSTEFAISRFFIPYLAKFQGWSLFCDSDFLFFDDVRHLFDIARSSDKAVLCVKHDYRPDAGVKMDGQKQIPYTRKNWSSLMLFNNEHPKNRLLEPSLLNALPGRDLHGFTWLDDDDIGELPPRWNWLEGHSDIGINPSAVHFTRGTPDVAGYELIPYAEHWNTLADSISLCRDK